MDEVEREDNSPTDGISRAAEAIPDTPTTEEGPQSLEPTSNENVPDSGTGTPTSTKEKKSIIQNLSF